MSLSLFNEGTLSKLKMNNRAVTGWYGDNTIWKKLHLFCQSKDIIPYESDLVDQDQTEVAKKLASQKEQDDIL